MQEQDSTNHFFSIHASVFLIMFMRSLMPVPACDCWYVRSWMPSVIKELKFSTYQVLILRIHASCVDDEQHHCDRPQLRAHIFTLASGAYDKKHVWLSHIGVVCWGFVGFLASGGPRGGRVVDGYLPPTFWALAACYGGIRTVVTAEPPSLSGLCGDASSAWAVMNRLILHAFPFCLNS